MVDTSSKSFLTERGWYGNRWRSGKDIYRKLLDTSTVAGDRLHELRQRCDWGMNYAVSCTEVEELVKYSSSFFGVDFVLKKRFG